MPTLIPTLNIVGTTATITDAEAAAINVLVFTVRNENHWNSHSFIIGNGTIELTGIAPGDYTARVMSIGSTGTVSDSVDFSIAGASLSGNVNLSWGRWIYASICQHFDTYRNTLYMFLEGTHRDTTDLQEWFELRVDGPFYHQFQKGWWEATVEINTIVTVAISDKDFHAIRRWTDFVAAIFTNSISIYRYGNEIGDDNTFVDCLKAEDGRRKNLQISHFGQLQPADAVMQASIERHYKVTLSEE